MACDLWILTPDGKELGGPLNFSLQKFQRVGLIGESGAGKSSLLGVILGFLPYRGSLRVNGHELRTLALSAWRERLSWISQNPVLPAKTLRDNVLLGSMESDDVQFMQAIKDAYVTEFLDMLPSGLDSCIGEDSGLLSVGQAQRVALARALIRTPDLMLLDEPIANLDVHSKRLIMHALENITRRQTTLLVTHQLQTIVNFDVVWVMHKGVIIQQGRYSDLAVRKGPLADLIATRS